MCGKFWLKASSLYISQNKRKCRLEVGENYNYSKADNAKVPDCSPENKKTIFAALEHFKILKKSDGT